MRGLSDEESEDDEGRFLENTPFVYSSSVDEPKAKATRSFLFGPTTSTPIASELSSSKRIWKK